MIPRCSARRSRCSSTTPSTITWTGIVAKRVGNRHQTIAPYDTYPTADGFICLAIGNDALWGRLCGVLGWPERGEDPRYARNQDRLARYEEVTAMIS